MAKHQHKTPPTRLVLAAAAALLAAASAAGCQGDRGAGPREPRAARGDRFPAGDQVRPVDRFAGVQSAAAARADATLNADHFDGRADLNSLGRRKLDLMLHDDAAPPVVVYVDLSRAAAAARAEGREAPSPDAHHAAVRAYLADRGLGAGQVDLRDGPNVGYSHSARDGLRGLRAFREEAPPVTDVSAGRRAGPADWLGEPPSK